VASSAASMESMKIYHRVCWPETPNVKDALLRRLRSIYVSVHPRYRCNFPSVSPRPACQGVGRLHGRSPRLAQPRVYTAQLWKTVEPRSRRSSVTVSSRCESKYRLLPLCDLRVRNITKAGERAPSHDSSRLGSCH
jgi:hypothetical protein